MRFWRRNKPDSGLPRGFDEILPPEGVPLRFRIAGAGVRLAAQVADILITVIASGAVLILLVTLELTEPNTMVAIVTLLFFVIRIPYYVLSELVWNGQTLGKRLLKIKVISADGGPMRAQSIVMRNLMKEAEIFLPGTLLVMLDEATPVASLSSLAWILAVLSVPLLTRRRQRLGDLIAGTFVIHLPEPLLFRDLALEAPADTTTREKFAFLTHHLDHYGSFELQTLEDLLRARDRANGAAQARRRRETLAAVVEQIRRKIDFADQVAETDHEAFLSAFYNAQRAYLEQRQLFGERRKDKRHAEENAPE